MVLYRVAHAMQRSNAGIAAPGKDQLTRGAHPDQLIVEYVGRHADQRQIAAFLTNHFMPRREWNQVCETFHRHHVAILDEPGDGL